MEVAQQIDTLWLLMSAVLVLLMQAGFLCFESGLTRSKNAINVAMKNAADFAIALLLFWAIGFGMMFGTSASGLIGTDLFLLDFNQSGSGLAAFFLFQSMFCATAATVVSGAVAERVRFNAYLILTGVIVLLIYPISGHWAWGGLLEGELGWLGESGFVDFAGSTVVHSVGGWVALAALLIVGPRLGRFSDGKPNYLPASNPTLAMIGIVFFLLGWMGFNGGSTLSLNEQVAGIIANTLIAGAVGSSVAYLLAQRINRHRTEQFVAPLNGCLAGLVAITAGCHAVSTMEAALIGGVGALVMLLTERWMLNHQLDDAIGAVPVHLAAGIWGTLAVGLFGDPEILGTGLSLGQQLSVQLIGIVSVGLWAFGLAYLLLKIIDRMHPLRVSVEDEQSGLNVSEHGARTDLIDLLTEMSRQESELDLSKRLAVEPFTEVGQIARGYNQVMDALERAVSETKAIVRDLRDAIVTFGEDGVLVSFNPAAERMFGYSSEAVIGRPLALLFDQEITRVRHNHSQVIGQFKLNETVETLGKRQSKERFFAEVTLTEGRVSEERRFTALIRDIDDKRRIEEQLYKEKERALVTLGSIVDGVITTDTSGRVTYMNDAAKTITGWKLREALGKPLGDVYMTSDSESAPAKDLLRRALEGHEVVIESQNTTLRNRYGQEHAIKHTLSPIRDTSSVVFGAVVVFHDVTSSRELEQRLSYQASHDALTGLLNRTGFESLTLGLMNKMYLQDTQHVIAFMDLDQFKIVNDTCGHLAGDELLRQISHLIKDKVRKDDVVARLGGDEFALLLCNCDQQAALQVADGIRQMVQDFRFSWQERQFALGVSIGMVSMTEDTRDFTKLMSAADSACYAAKDKGRNRIQFDEINDQELSERRDQMQWVTKIREALDNQRMRLYFQPIIPVKADSELESHVEMFVRLISEEGEIYPPGAFIPVAERYNLIQEIDLWVFENTCKWLQDLNSQGVRAPKVAINLSGQTVGETSSLDKIITIFDQYQIEFERVSFEITETSAISNLGSASRFMKALSQKGCLFSLDDFGSGLSSFGYLRNLPVDYLKIDGVFIRDIDTNSIDRVMVDSINTIGHEMGLKTIAEYVENASIMEVLADLGIDYAQGYYIDRPKSIEDWLPDLEVIKQQQV